MLGRALVCACKGPLTVGEWEATRETHLVCGERLYGNHTYAYYFENVQSVAPIKINRKRGAIIWQRGPALKFEVDAAESTTEGTNT